jgi:Phospholipid-translocating P-type ATPase C-terminal
MPHDHRGYQDGLYVFGTTIYTVLVISMLLKVCTMTWTWNVVGGFCIGASLLLYFGFILIYSSVLDWAYGFYAVGYELFARAGFWLLVIQVSM